MQQHLWRTEILAEWLLEKIDEAADITPSRQIAELTWSMSLPLTSTIEQKKYRKS